VKAPELCDKRFPDVKFLIPGLIPEGVTLLVSRPKLGKSWLLQRSRRRLLLEQPRSRQTPAFPQSRVTFCISLLRTASAGFNGA
jgi:hypothetical protein